MKLRSPQEHELEALSALCLRSKAVWGYDQAFLDACRAELTIRFEELETTAICVAEHDGALVGVTQITIAGDTAELQKMFVEPGAIGLGIGKALFAWASSKAKALGARHLTIDADPGAVGFYRKMGAIERGTVPSDSIPGRMLPRLEVELTTLATTS
jgi:GNAT superfamily N-acetyltransferase